jgi:hypothetical protein
MPHDYGKERKYCLMCSRLALDGKAKKVIEDVTYIDLFTYMKQKKTPGGNTYLKATYDVERVNDMIMFLEEIRNKNNQENPDDVIEDIRDFKIDVQSENTIIAQITPKPTTDAWNKAIWGGAGVVAVLLAPVTFGGSLSITTVGLATLSGAATTGILYIKEYPDGEKEYIYPSLYPYEIEALQALECHSFETAP